MIVLTTATNATLMAAAVMFLWALLLGVVKYGQTTNSVDHVAHPYMDTAHRAALLYSFALLLVATFVQLSRWNQWINLTAALVMAAFFFASVAIYMFHGLCQDTDNQFKQPIAGTHFFMAMLIVAEIGGWLVLVTGFVAKQFA